MTPRRVATKARHPRLPSPYTPTHNVGPDSVPQRLETWGSGPAAATTRRAASGQRQARARAGNGRGAAAAAAAAEPQSQPHRSYPRAPRKDTHVDRQRPRVDGRLGAHRRLEPQLQLLAHVGARGRRTMLGGRLGEGRGRRREGRQAGGLGRTRGGRLRTDGPACASAAAALWPQLPSL